MQCAASLNSQVHFSSSIFHLSGRRRMMDVTKSTRVFVSSAMANCPPRLMRVELLLRFLFRQTLIKPSSGTACVRVSRHMAISVRVPRAFRGCVHFCVCACACSSVLVGTHGRVEGRGRLSRRTGARHWRSQDDSVELRGPQPRSLSDHSTN